MSIKYFGETRLIQILTNLKNYFANKTELETAIAALTAEDVGALSVSAAKEYLEEYAAPKSHEHPIYENIITSIKVNGVEQTVVDKAVDINVPKGNLATKDTVELSDLSSEVSNKFMSKPSTYIENDIVIFDADGNASDSNMRFVLNEDNSLTLQITV